ncbi:hypothetical protein [Nocardia sp. NPDC046763]|uniref:hypothetical protein n=1 Tax=Nocardia sp. NPDC046763 TaxID=3155256 RepID=UPI0033C84354
MSVQRTGRRGWAARRARLDSMLRRDGTVEYRRVRLPDGNSADDAHVVGQPASAQWDTSASVW